MRLAMAAAGLLTLAGCSTWGQPGPIGRPDKMTRNDQTTYEREYCEKKGNSDDVINCRRNSQDIPAPVGASIGSSRRSGGTPKIPAA